MSAMSASLMSLMTGAWAAGGTATVPVDELLALHEAQRVSDADEPAPPVAGALDSVRMSGRVLGDTIDLIASVQVSVLADGSWTSIPILDLGPELEVLELPDLLNAWLTVEDGTLSLIARQRGRYTFDLKLSAHAAALGDQRSAGIKLADPTAASLELGYDPERIRLDTSGALGAEPDAVRLRPTDGTFLVRWTAAALDEAPRQVARRSLEPTVERAVASVVSTLEGTRLTRVRYALRLEGAQRLELSWPSGQELERVYVNGSAVAVEPEGGRLGLDVRPERDGGEDGSVEIVLSEDRGGYLLSGTLDFVMPAVSWPTRELVLSLHLPEVFTYAWSGGSMEASEGEPEAVFAYDVPTPGAASTWHQELVVRQAPSLRLDYTVDLEGAYYKP